MIRLANLGYLPTNYYSRGFEYRTDIIPAVIERLHHYLEEFKVLISWLWHRFKWLIVNGNFLHDYQICNGGSRIRILVKTKFPNLAFITDISFTTPLCIVENYSLNIGKNDLQVYLIWRYFSWKNYYLHT